MAIYKTSNHSPNLQEVDLTQDNTFSCMVNTSGENIVAYKMSILSGRGDEKIYSPKEPTLITKPIKNKGILKINNINDSLHDEDKKLENGKDYQWGIRVYNQPPHAATKPNTLVCEGFLVGSTKYVVWCDIPNQDTPNSEGGHKNEVDEIVYDRYIEFDTDGTQMIKGAKDPIDLKAPENEYKDGKTLIERRKIDWVTKQLGSNKNIVKIETADNFTYNYKDGTPFKIYKCSNEHTAKSFFVDPNYNINVSDYVVLFKDAESAKAAMAEPAADATEEEKKYQPYNPANDKEMQKEGKLPAGLVRLKNKIVGYSSDTGEIRLEQAYENTEEEAAENKPLVPENGWVYVLFEYDNIDKIYKEVGSDTKTVKDDTENTEESEPEATALSDTESENTEINKYEKQVIGGLPVTNELYRVMTNKWDDEAKRLFVQPNINIKSDDTNPNELVFDSGERIDINKQYWMNNGVEVDITFDKLDNTQWLLTKATKGEVIEEENLFAQAPSVAEEEMIPPIIPQTDYKVYTDFMDCTPYNLFYARNTPVLTIQCKNNNGKNEEDIDYKDMEEYDQSKQNYYSYREIAFQTLISNSQQEVKYYYYTLYDEDGNIVDESSEIYSNEIVWYYRGLESGVLSDTREVVTPKKYTVEVVVVDEYNSKFVQRVNFGVYYNTTVGVIPLTPEKDCHEKAIKISAVSPVYVQTTNDNMYETVTNKDIVKNGEDFWVNIPNGHTLNYTNVINQEKTPIVIPEDFSIITQFQITGDFASSVPNGGELEICSFAHKKSDGSIEQFSVRLSSYIKFFWDSQKEDFIMNNDVLRIKVYRDNEENPLKCFSKKDYYDIEANGLGDFQYPVNLAYALQEASNYIFITPENEEDSGLPDKGEYGKKYVLTKSTKSYLAGIWAYSSARGWVADYSTQFVYIENIDQIPDNYLANFIVPVDCLENDEELLFTESSNIYLDNLEYFENINQKAFNERWFVLYLVSNSQEEEIVCNIKINKGGVV